MRKIAIVLAVSLLACWPAGLAFAQALPNINLLSVRYNSMKTAAKAEGELKAQLDEIDKAIADARRSGNIGEMRRQIAKGFTVLDKGAWTPQLDYRSSLALRSERIVIDSAVPYAMRIEQIYRPAIDLSANLTTKVRIRKRVPPARAGEQAAAAEAAALRPSRELGTFDGVSRDLRETPYAIELDLAAIEDGAQLIEAEVFDGATSLGAATLSVFLHKGLDAKLKALDTAAATATPAVRADVMFPADYIKNVNRGRIELADFNVGGEVAKAEEVLAQAQGGPQKAQKAQTKNPFEGRTGDFERHYLLEGANEIMPYRVYVPKGYSASKATPLVIALHGLGANEDSFFDAYSQLPPQLAEKHGFLMAAPLGFRRDGFYGSGDHGRQRCRANGAGEIQREGRARSAAADEGRLQRRRLAHLSDRPFDGRDRHVGAWREVSADVGGAGRVLRRRRGVARGQHESDSAVRRPWRRRQHGQRVGVAQHGGGVEEAERKRDLHRSAGRQPHRRGRAESAAGL